MVDLYVSDIRNALKIKCYFSALALSLALPDICGTAEYPDESSTAKRYIEWYDKYLGEYFSTEGKEPFLSGEIVYNLRNTFLHSGSPNIDANKVKNESNQLDKFMLILGDGTKIWRINMYIDTPIVSYRTMTIDITYLCQTISDCAECYYNNNKSKFHFDFTIDTQEHLFQSASEKPEGDIIVKLVNQKLESEGKAVQFIENPNHTMLDSMVEGLHKKIENGEKITLSRPSATYFNEISIEDSKTTSANKVSDDKPVSKPKKKKVKQNKREAQVRSFFEQHFKEKKFRAKKEQIIQAVLQSKTKQQVNNTLMKHFTSNDVGTIYKRLSPLIATFPGK